MGYLPYGLTGVLTEQNQVNTQSANVRPNMPGYAGIDKLPFDMMRTPEDQIHWLYLFAKQAENLHITKDEAQELIDAACAAFKSWVVEDQQRQDDDVAEKYDYLLKLIYELVGFNGMVYDPTQGKQDGVRRVAEHIYDFDRVFAVTAADFDTRYAWTAGKYDSEAIVARDYDVAFVAYNYLDKLGYETQDANSNWFMQRLRATMGDMGFLNFDSPLDNEGGTVRLMLGQNSPLKIEDGALQVKAVAPVTSSKDGVGIDLNEPLYSNAGKLDLQVEEPINTDGGAVSLSHDVTLKVDGGQLGVQPFEPLYVNPNTGLNVRYASYGTSVGDYGVVVFGYGYGDVRSNDTEISVPVRRDTMNDFIAIGIIYNDPVLARDSSGNLVTKDTFKTKITQYDQLLKDFDTLQREVYALESSLEELQADYEAFKPTCVTEGIVPLYKED